jgi:hypothetical protein
MEHIPYEQLKGISDEVRASSSSSSSALFVADASGWF